jgi:DNA-binding NarL/FixJ family response regulator
MINVLLVDDDVLVRQGLRMRLELEPDLVISGEAGDGRQALALVQSLHPKVVIIDLRMPGMDGIMATERLQEIAPEVAVVVLSNNDDRETRERARAAGAAAFVGKLAPAEHLLSEIRRVAGR